jgi:O-antigen/teichoic acid export membrane protein
VDEQPPIDGEIQPQPPGGVSIRQRLVGGSMRAFAGRAGTALASVALNAVLARLLTPEDFGAYFLAFTLVSVSAMVARLGLAHTATRVIAEAMGTDRPGRARAMIRLATRITVLSSVLIALLLMTGIAEWIADSLFESDALADVAIIAAVWVITMALEVVFSEIARGFHLIGLAVLFQRLLSSSLSIVLFAVIWTVRGEAELSEVLVVSIAAGIAANAIAAFAIGRRAKDLDGPGSIALPEAFSVALPLMATNVLLFVLAQGDIWIMGAVFAEDEVAVYASAVKLVTLAAMPLFIVNAVLPPIIAELNAKQDLVRLERVLRSTATIGGAPSLLVAVAFIAFGGPILGLIYGSFYRDGATVLAILSLAQVARVAAGSSGFALMMTGEQQLMSGLTAVFGILTIGGAILAAEPYGKTGVAVAVAVGAVLRNAATVLAVKRRLGIWTHITLSGRAIREAAKSI